MRFKPSPVNWVTIGNIPGNPLVGGGGGGWTGSPLATFSSSTSQSKSRQELSLVFLALLTLLGAVLYRTINNVYHFLILKIENYQNSMWLQDGLPTAWFCSL